MRALRRLQRSIKEAGYKADGSAEARPEAKADGARWILPGEPESCPRGSSRQCSPGNWQPGGSLRLASAVGPRLRGHDPAYRPDASVRAVRPAGPTSRSPREARDPEESPRRNPRPKAQPAPRGRIWLRNACSRNPRGHCCTDSTHGSTRLCKRGPFARQHRQHQETSGPEWAFGPIAGDPQSSANRALARIALGSCSPRWARIRSTLLVISGRPSVARP